MFQSRKPMPCAAAMYGIHGFRIGRRFSTTQYR